MRRMPSTPVHIEPVATGLINRTYRVTGENGLDYILQEVNERFPPEINLDIDVVTRHLEQSGLLTPRLLPTAAAGFIPEDGRVWRLFSHISGNVHERLEQPEMAGAAGALLGRVHAALALLDYELQTSLPLTHDAPRHASHLKNTLEKQRGHARHAAIKPLGEAILARLEQLPPLPAVSARLGSRRPEDIQFHLFRRRPRRAVHGRFRHPEQDAGVPGTGRCPAFLVQPGRGRHSLRPLFDGPLPGRA